MSKIIIILLLILLVGCNKAEPIELMNEATASPTLVEDQSFTLNDQQVEQLNMVIYSGGFFDDVIGIDSDLSYQIKNDTITVELNNQTLSEVKFVVDDYAHYTYTFRDIELDYTKDKKNKSATLSSTYTRAPNLDNTRIRSTLNTNDNQSFKISFNQTRYVIEDNGTPNVGISSITFVDSLSEQLFKTYENQWNELMKFDSLMQTLNHHISAIFKNDESYTFKTKDYLMIDNRVLYDWQKEKKKEIPKSEYTERAIRTSFMHDFYYYSLNGEQIKSAKEISAYENSLFLFFFLKSADNFSIEELTGAFMSVESEYHCMGKSCNRSKDEKELTISQGTSGEGYYSVMTLDYFNNCIQSVFSLEPYTITEPKALKNGIIQSKEEKTFVGESYAGDGPRSYNGAIYEHYKEDGIDYVTFTPYINRNGYSDENGVITYDIYTSAGDLIQRKMDSSKIHDYVVAHKDQFLTWEISLAPGSHPDFYQILSYQLK